MAKPPPTTTARRGADGMLQVAIDDVLLVARSWFWVTMALGAFASILAFAGVVNRMFIIGFVSNTHSEISLESALIFWTMVTVLLVAFHVLQMFSVAAVSRYVAKRLAVPSVLAITQRSGSRPDATASAAIADIETIRNSLAGQASQAAVAIVLTPLLIALVFILHWGFGVLALAFCAILGLLSVLVTRNSQRAAILSGGAQGRLYGLAADAMRCGEAVLAMGLLPRLAPSWVAVASDGSGEAYRAESDATRLRSIMEAVTNSLRGAIILFSTAIILSGDQKTTLLAGALFIVSRLVQPFTALGANAQELGEGLAAWRRLRAQVREAPGPPDGLAYPCPEGRLSAERVTFTFRAGTPALLRNLDLVVEPGEIVAIIGASGSGKSTLMRLLIGIFRPSAGGVYLDGHATWQWDRRDLARHAGFLPQQPLLSRGTAAEVIARLETPNMPLVIDAAKRAGAHEVLIGLPLGYATPIEGNYQLSMGQRHRIALARAIYGRPKLLLLDELGASLDAEGEAQVVRLLGTLREEGGSAVFTTHRPALLEAADRVLAIRNGALVPAGGRTPRLPGRTRSLGQPEAVAA